MAEEYNWIVIPYEDGGGDFGHEIIKIYALTGASESVHTYTDANNVDDYKTQIIRIYGDVILAVTAQIGGLLGNLVTLITSFSTDGGSSWTDRNDQGFSINNILGHVLDAFYLNSRVLVLFSEGGGNNVGVADFTVGVLTNYQSSTPDHYEHIWAGYQDTTTDQYYFMIYNGSLIRKYYWKESDNSFNLVETVLVSVPTIWNVNLQQYQIQTGSSVFVDAMTFRISFDLEVSWTEYTSSTETTIGIIWSFDHLGIIFVPSFIWDSIIKTISDNGVIKNIQALEPRDYKKVYLSNLNENLTGVVQFQDANGNDDLNAWTDLSGTDCTISIIEKKDGHLNVLELDDQGSGSACFLSQSIGVQISGAFEFFIGSDNVDAKVVLFQVIDATQTLLYLYLSGGNIYYFGAAGGVDIGDYVADILYHIRIEFDCGTDLQQIYINNVQVVTDGPFYLSRTATDLQNVRLRTDSTDTGYKGYFDAIGFSWDSYISGSNKKINAFVGFLPNNVSAWDHKLTYLTNEAITGIVQVGTAADPDLTDWTVITAPTSFTVESVYLVHTNIIKLTTATIARVGLDFTGVTSADFEFLIGQTVTGSSSIAGLGASTISHASIRLVGGGTWYYYTNSSLVVFPSGKTFVANQIYHVRIRWVSNTSLEIWVDDTKEVDITVNIYNGTLGRFLYVVTGAAFDSYLDGLGFVKDGYVAGSNNTFPDLTFPKPWFATGDADTGIMQLALKDWTPGTIKALVESEMYRAPKYSLIRLTPPFEDEWLDQYTDAGQHYYGGKVSDNNNDNRFFWLYLMKNWQDENAKTKINETLLGYTHKEMLEFVIDKYSKYRYFGPGTNGGVNEFTPSQIDGSEDDWANTDGTDCESSYVTKKGFLNGFISHIMQQFDDGVGACLVVLSNQSFTIFSIKVATNDVVNQFMNMQFKEGATSIGELFISGSNLKWYDGAVQTLEAVVIDTIYHIALVFNVGDDEVDIYINGLFHSTQNLINNITTSISTIRFLTPGATSGGTSYFANLYMGASLVDAMHTFSSISPLLTTTQDFHLKNMSFAALEEQIAEETGYIVSERPDGQVYVDQYGASGKEINAQVAITYQSLMQVRNEKFSFITLYGGFVNGIQITAEGFGEPNFGSYEDWFPMIQGRDADDIYYDADGNPKSHRLDAMVTTALANKNIVIKKQVVGKRGVGMLHVGQSLTYTTDHYKIAGETWNAWRKNAYNAKADDNRVEIADSFLSPTRSDPNDNPTAAAINENTTNITKNDQNIAYLAERIRSRDVLSMYLEENQRNLDQSVWGFFNLENNGVALDSVTPINYTIGCHRILIVVNAGSDFDGTITITGNTRDRDDSNNLTVADTEVITIDALTTDNSSADSEGNIIHGFVDAYMTDKWFEGAVSITTTNVTLTDVDTYGILYHQFDSFKLVTLKTLDFTGKVTNANGWFYGYLYVIDCDNTNDKKYLIDNIANLEIPSSLTVAGEGYRRRKVIERLINGEGGHGIWLEVFFGPAASTYWNDISIYLTALLDNGTDE